VTDDILRIDEGPRQSSAKEGQDEKANICAVCDNARRLGVDILA
jgi:hypothetical protein